MTLTSITPRPNVQSYVTADVKCYLCGQISGAVESQQQPLPRRVQFRRAGEERLVEVADWHQLRCIRCGGGIFLDDPEVVTRRVETYDWLEERPRRGRPPKRLLEERRRQEELLNSQAA
jgi:hypothetical protein